jgi:hypothetical protein
VNYLASRLTASIEKAENDRVTPISESDTCDHCGKVLGSTCLANRLGYQLCSERCREDFGTPPLTPALQRDALAAAAVARVQAETWDKADVEVEATVGADDLPYVAGLRRQGRGWELLWVRQPKDIERRMLMNRAEWLCSFYGLFDIVADLAFVVAQVRSMGNEMNVEAMLSDSERGMVECRAESAAG